MMNSVKSNALASAMKGVSGGSGGGKSGFNYTEEDIQRIKKDNEGKIVKLKKAAEV